jgi:threonine dehydratase
MRVPLAICADDVRDAARLISAFVVRTPLLENLELNERAGARVLVKFEGAQHTGSFKFRGAYNRLARLDGRKKAASVVAWSSGNHAQGVAAVARRLRMPATIVMPSDAPAIKIANTRALGADVVIYDRGTESREAIATELAKSLGAILVPSYDDPFIIAGQGTIGLEILEQIRETNITLGRILVCCGGGGLVAGIATAIKDAEPRIEIYSVEPAGFDDTARSLVSGVREDVTIGATSICDALLAVKPGELTFPINHMLLSGGLVVTDDQVKEAMRFAFEKLKLVIEPGGAVALAAVLNRLGPATDRPIVVVVSGANVDPETYASIITGEQ